MTILTGDCREEMPWHAPYDMILADPPYGDTSLACSADTQNEIDRKVVELVKRQHEKASKILADNRGKLDELAKYLYEKETITGEEFMSILNKGGEKE